MAKKRQNTPKAPPTPPFSLRLSQEERSELENLAEGRPLGQFIKDCIFSKGLRPAAPRKVPIHDRKALAEVLAALGASRISQNINQLAKAVNTGSLPVIQDTEDALNEACDAIFWIRDALIKAMGLKPQREADKENGNDP